MWVCLALASMAAVVEAGQNTSSPVLDTAKAGAWYQMGQVDSASASIESFLASRRPHTRAESLFIAKHLAVLYSPDPVNRPQGKAYMRRMLELDPEANLDDMYASEDAESLYKMVKREMMAEAAARAATESRPASPPTASRSASPDSAGSQRKGKRSGYWIAGGAAAGAAVAAGVGYYVFAHGSDVRKERVVIRD